MNEQEAIEVLLGKPHEERLRILIDKALKRSPTVTMFRGECGFIAPSGCYGLVLFVPDEEEK